MYFKVLIKIHRANYLCYSEAVTFFIRPFLYLTPDDIQLSGISPKF